MQTKSLKNLKATRRKIHCVPPTARTTDAGLVVRNACAVPCILEQKVFLWTLYKLISLKVSAVLSLPLRMPSEWSASGKGQKGRQASKYTRHAEAYLNAVVQRVWINKTVAQRLKLGIFSFCCTSRIKFSNYTISGCILKQININLVTSL